MREECGKSKMAQSTPPTATAGKCPICGRPTVQDYRPFCSRRCADVDLSRWLRGTYAIPDEAEDEDGDQTNPPAEDRGDPDPGRH
jgi:endogenous inhibitor of DNA gyrase (YacG/DUF329 family)